MSLGNLGLIDVEELVQAQEPLIDSSVSIENEGKAAHFKTVLGPEIVIGSKPVVEHGYIIPMHLVLHFVKHRVPLAYSYCLVI